MPRHSKRGSVQSSSTAVQLAEADHVILFSQSHVLFTTTGSKQDVRLAEKDHVIWFSQLHGYYTLLLLCLL